MPTRILLTMLLLAATARADQSIAAISTDPSAIALDGPTALTTILVHGRTAAGQMIDLTGVARFASADPKIVAVSNNGIVRPVNDGTSAVQIEANGHTLELPVTVTGAHRPRRFNFENDIIPLLSRYSCNASGCHGKAEGQNGFKLSVFGFDPYADFVALTKESRSRRVFLAAPEQSLLLTKISGRVAHGGGLRLQRATSDYETLRAWIAAGVPFGNKAEPRVESIRVQPTERQLAMTGRQQLRVVARYSDGRETDVTLHSKFLSNNEGLAAVSPTGLVTVGEVPGEVAVMASFMGAVDTFRAIVPRSDDRTTFPDFPANNFIDPLVAAKLKKLKVVPSGLCSDADYLRRVYLDVIGTLPTAAEARRFLADQRPDRRARLVDELLKRPEFADYWALKWSDLLRVDRQALGHKRAYGFYRWIRDSIAANKPYDRFVRELLTAEGPLAEVGPANFYKVVNKPGEAASTLSQVFLGVRIACAECHHHPFDRWSQTDYYGMQAFFTQVGVRSSPQAEMVMTAGDPVTHHPRTGQTIFAHGLGAVMPDKSPDGDRRRALAGWMTSPTNTWFARNFANRAWAHFLGRGLVEPVDDVRATNPPTNPELLDALAQYVVESKFDFHALIRTIIASRTYQLASTPNATNERDEQNNSRAALKRVDAEVLFDMVCQVTGVPEKFPGVPAGVRAIQLWDSKVPHYFLKLFGRPVRVTACECERVGEPSVSQVLHLLNSPEIHAKMVHDGGLVARLVQDKTDSAALIDELYLTFFARFPTEQEKGVALDYFKNDSRRQAAEDLAWGLMNSLEFVFNH
jgi:hypothetical protein